MWVWPQVPLGGPPPPPHCALGPLPPTSLGRPLPEPSKKSQGGGWGEEGRRGQGGRGFGLREGSSNYNGGQGGPSKHQLGPDPHLGLPIYRGGAARLGLVLAKWSILMRGLFCPEIRAFTGFGARFLQPFPKSLVTVRYYSNTKMAVNSHQWPLMGDMLVQRKAPIGAT